MGINKFAETLGKLAGLNPWDVPVNQEVQNHIVALYNQVHGEGGEAFAERESRYLNRLITDDKAKWNVTPLSVFLAYVDLAVKDLTLEPGAQALCYLMNRNTKLKDGKGQEYWENRVYISITGYGEIFLRQRAGQIRHCDTPTVVYEGDRFGYEESDGKKIVSYGLNLDHNPSKPIACFVKITRLDGTTDYGIMLPEGWARLKGYSDKQNKDRKNQLYTSGIGGDIDPGFLIAKCVKHAFKTYPKLPIGKGMMMQSDIPEQEEEMPDYYSMGDRAETAKAQSFAEPKDMTGGVTIDPAAEYEDSSNDGAF